MAQQTELSIDNPTKKVKKLTNMDLVMYLEICLSNIQFHPRGDWFSFCPPPLLNKVDSPPYSLLLILQACSLVALSFSICFFFNYIFYYDTYFTVIQIFCYKL